MVDELDNCKIRTACWFYLAEKVKEASAQELVDYISKCDLPLRRRVTAQTVTFLLKTSVAQWGFKWRKDKRNRKIWSVNREWKFPMSSLWEQ